MLALARWIEHPARGAVHAWWRELDSFHASADDFACAVTPSQFYAVGLWYREFKPVSNEDVRELLSQAAYERETLALAAAMPARALRTA